MYFAWCRISAIILISTLATWHDTSRKYVLAFHVNKESRYGLKPYIFWTIIPYIFWKNHVWNAFITFNFVLMPQIKRMVAFRCPSTNLNGVSNLSDPFPPLPPSHSTWQPRRISVSSDNHINHELGRPAPCRMIKTPPSPECNW